MPAAVHQLIDQQLQSPAGHFDELRDAHGETRGAWLRFFDTLGAQPLEELARRKKQLDRQILENGVTFNVYTEPESVARPWRLELLPVIIEHQDWLRIEAGVKQRASLLNMMLADAYGDKRLLRNALLPAALVYGHPGYLRSMQGCKPPGGIYLHIVAFELAHGPDGRYWVMDQRTQAPSGLGYTLENRVTLSRLFPQAFRELNIQHVASSYRRLLDTLQNLSTRAAGDRLPRVVLLTPGPSNETYFEHAYLARYLGLTLVEGGDLTVRDNHLYLKTVQGLEPVHGVLRHLDDDYCDPLELRPDSTLGVPGLMQAVRAGNVMMANSMGTGFLESPAIQGFLPAIANRWLGQELILPALNTWWCGERSAWEAVSSELPGKVVQATYPSIWSTQNLRASFEPELLSADAASLTQWRTRIHRDPDAHMLRLPLPYSQSPAWMGDRLGPRGVTLRVYAIADGHGGWQVLPGGMARTTTDHTALSMQRGGASLDTWVQTTGPVDTFSMLPQPLSVQELAAQQRLTSSRTAENMFWLGRYAERTEYVVRLATVLLTMLRDEDENTSVEVKLALSRLAVESGLLRESDPNWISDRTGFERAMVAQLTQTQGAASVSANLQGLVHTGSNLRDRLSSEHWRLLRDMGVSFAARAAHAQATLNGTDALPALEGLALQLAAVTGAQLDRMTRDLGWRMLAIGRHVERLINLGNTLEIFFNTQAVMEPHGFDVLLSLFDSTITFRARFQRRLEIPALLELLVMDETNPRAMASVLRWMRHEISMLPAINMSQLTEPNNHRRQFNSSTQMLLSLVPREGVGVTLGRLCEKTLPFDGTLASESPVPPWAHHLTQSVMRLSNELSWLYFAHAGVRDLALSAA